MSKTKLQIPAEFENASTEERIAFVTELWDHIVQSGDDVPIPDHHRKILDERLRDYRANPQPGVSGSEPPLSGTMWSGGATKVCGCGRTSALACRHPGRRAAVGTFRMAATFTRTAPGQRTPGQEMT
jgi:putative addiction module component (TIGR02574 family)